MFQKLFHLKENGTDVKTEVIGGITTFMAMAYILAVNPSILSQSGMDSQAVLIATALAAFVGTLCMAFMANYPFALAPGLGLNAYFAYTVCGTMGYSWELALLAVFAEGLVFLALIGLVIISVLYIKNVKGSILLGILITWALGILAQFTGLYAGDSVLPVWSDFNLGAISKTFGQCFSSAAFANFRILDFIVIMFSFLFVDIFDTLGTMIACADKAKMLDKDGKLPRIRSALLADSIATSCGAILGTSTTTTFVESSSGVSEGARTGLASVVTGLLFFLSIFLSPIFIAIPGFATAPALIFVGFLMITAVKDIHFDNAIEAIPAYLTLLTMPILYSISDGIAVGFISYVILHLFTGKAKEIKPLMYILAVLFVLKYIFL